MALALLIAVVVPSTLGSIYDWGPWGFGWMMWFMPVFMIAFWGLVIWAVVALVQGVSLPRSPGVSPSQEGSALEILKRRYARGEISKEEYEDKKRDLI